MRFLTFSATCEQQDSIRQGCSSDAVTVVNESITDNGRAVDTLQVHQLSATHSAEASYPYRMERRDYDYTKSLRSIL